jgi:hypothetical protein
MKSCPVAAWEILCDALVACLGIAQMREGHALPSGFRKYVGVIPDATVENHTMVRLLGIWHGVIIGPL